MTTPMVSIVMAAFNEERYIGEAIESVLAQTYPDFEFIIINDGSTDRTEEIILSYKDPRIRYLKNGQNLKLIASLNKGLKAASGRYIARMDSDDVCMPDRLEQQVNFMEAHPEIGISGSQLLVFGSQEGIMHYPLSHEDIKLRLLITSCFGNNVVIFRKRILEEYRLFFPEGYIHAEDYKCWTSWVSVTQTANLDVCLVKYRSHAGSVSMQHRSIQRNTRNRIRAEYIEKEFNLKQASEVAANLTGLICFARLRAVKTILRSNQTDKRFDHSKFKRTLVDLWYSDSLEEAEAGFSVVLKYPLVFVLGFKKNIKNWVFLLKHYLKFRFNK